VGLFPVAESADLAVRDAKKEKIRSAKMNHNFPSSRRRFMQLTGLSVAGAASFPSWLDAMEMKSPKGRGAVKADPSFKADVEIELVAKSSQVQILPGKPTGVFSYSAQLISGSKDAVIEIPGSYLGPLLQLRTGQKIRIHFKNELPEESIVHWHGLHVPSEQDGHPSDSIQPGEIRVYEFEIKNRAGLHIYHPHSHEKTATQVYYGLAGGLLIRDTEEEKLGLPSGEHELPLVIQDRRFDENNQLVYGRTMHDRTLGFAGNRVLVNGKSDPVFDVATRAYRLRVMNGSNSRIYKLAWSDGTAVSVLGVDGGLLESPEVRPYVMLAPGERLDLWMDFSGRGIGSELILKSLAFKGALPKMHEAMMAKMGGMAHGGGNAGGMMGGMMGHHELPIGSEYPIARFRITRVVAESSRMPTQLSRYRTYRLSETANPDHAIPIGISEGPGSMLLNGRAYADDDIQPFERVPLNTLQLVVISHAHGGHGNAQGQKHDGDSKEAHSMGEGKGAAQDHEGSAGTGMKGMSHGGGMMGGMMGMQHGQAKAEGSSRDGMDHAGGMGMGDGMSGMGGGMGMMMSMAHPIHLHGQQFQVLSRSVSGDDTSDYETVKEGLITRGLKDTVLLMPGEKIRLIKPFEDFKGRFMYHCHNLEHEDLGMMREFEIY
jgi:FtsP/CotA-like multicopper oxidase with cupredoxin domain